MRIILVFGEVASFALYFKNKNYIFILLPLSIINLVIGYKDELKKNKINTWQLSRLIGSVFISALLFLNYFFDFPGVD